MKVLIFFILMFIWSPVGLKSCANNSIKLVNETKNHVIDFANKHNKTLVEFLNGGIKETYFVEFIYNGWSVYPVDSTTRIEISDVYVSLRSKDGNTVFTITEKADTVEWTGDSVYSYKLSLYLTDARNSSYKPGMDYYLIYKKNPKLRDQCYIQDHYGRLVYLLIFRRAEILITDEYKKDNQDI